MTGLAFSHTATVSCLHKNAELHHINNTYMLRPDARVLGVHLAFEFLLLRSTASLAMGM